MKRELRWYDIITVNIFYLGLTTIAQTMAPLVIPLLVQQFVGEEQKGTYFGIARLWALMAAVLSQALMGMLSDRSTHPWGRRRPFILFGALANLVMIAGIGLSGNLSGLLGFSVMFVMYVLQQAAINAAHSAEQGFIPDLVPPEQHGRYSSVKALLEIPIPVILISFTIAPTIGAGNMWGALLILAIVVIATMALAMLVPEKQLTVTPPPLDWQPFVRLVLMTGLFTVIILAMGEVVKLTGRLVQGVDSIPTLFGVMGIAGLLAMGAAVVVGVWGSVRLSLGREESGKSKSFTWWVIGRLAFLVGINNLAGFVLYFLQGRLGFTRASAAAPASQMMLLVGVFILLSALPSGWLTDKFGCKRIVTFSGIAAALGTLITLFATNLTLVYIGGSIIGIATGTFYTASWALGTGLVPKDRAGRYLGLSNLAGAGAGAIGAYIGGPAADFFTTHVPESPGLGYVLIFAIYGLLFLISVLTLIKVKEPTQAPTPA